MRAFLLGTTILLLAMPASAQQRGGAVTERRLTTADARFPHTFSSIRGLRELPDGRVMVADGIDEVLMIADLKTAGLKEVKINVVEESGNWELVCEELCGQGHNTMTAVVTFLEPAEYDKLNLDKPYKAPTTAPAQ